MKMFRTEKGSNKIAEHEIIGSTEKTVTYQRWAGSASRENRKSEYQHWFQTRLEAQDYLLAMQVNDLKLAKQRVSKIEAELAEFCQRENVIQ